MMMAAVGLGDTAGVCTRSVSAGEATGGKLGVTVRMEWPSPRGEAVVRTEDYNRGVVVYILVPEVLVRARTRRPLVRAQGN